MQWNWKNSVGSNNNPYQDVISYNEQIDYKLHFMDYDIKAVELAVNQRNKQGKIQLVWCSIKLH